MNILDKIAETELHACQMTKYDRQAAAELFSKILPGPFPADFLPETGIVVRQNGIALCYIPVYLEQTSSVAVLGHFIADPHADRKLLARAVRLAINQARNFAREHHKKYLVSIFGRNSINRIADKMGFISGDVAEEKICYLE